MQFTLYAAGHAYDNGKPTQKSGCAAVLVATDGEQEKYREIAHHLEAATGPQSELQASYLALAAVKPRLRSHPVTLHLTSYPARLLERSASGWSTNAKSNERLVERLRSLVLQFDQLSVVSVKSDGLMRALELAKVAASSQTQSDTGSLDRTTGVP